MWLSMLAIKYYFNCSGLYGRWKWYGNFHPKTKSILLYLLEMNCKINNLGGAKILYFVHK